MRATLVMWACVAAGSAAQGQILRMDEAEDCKVTCRHKEAGETIWASGGKVTPPFWGIEPGESVEWTIDAEKPQEGLKLAIRYSYAAQHYRDFHHTENRERLLHLTVDGGKPIPVHVPDTGWWDIFETAHVVLPALSAGEHVLRIVSPAPHATTNLDCFMFYKGDAKRVPPNLRSTIVRLTPPDSAPSTQPTSPRFAIRVTPKAPLKLPPQAILRQFDRIWDTFEKYMGWAPPTPVGINIIEDAKWPNPGATAFQNNYGVFFRAGVMHTEQGNWCHEMTHMFYVAHFPGWFDESSVHCLTVLHWVPTLFSHESRPEDATRKAWITDATRFLNTPGETTDNMVLIQNAVMVKYGREVFSRFFHACLEAGKKGELDFRPGRHLTKAEIVKYMSLAAGEDVEPLYRRWRGFNDVP